jgi:hypothetical protein
MEEVIEYKCSDAERQATIRAMWTKRLDGVQRFVSSHYVMLLN